MAHRVWWMQVLCLDAPTRRHNEGMGTVGSRLQGWQCLWRTVRVDTLAWSAPHERAQRLQLLRVYGLVSGEVLSGNTGAESLVGKPGKERCNGDALPLDRSGAKQSRKQKRFANRYDSYEWTTYPVREETLYCAFASKFAAPFTCPWELPGCSQPRYPPYQLSTRALVFGAWGKLVQLSYFHFWPVLVVGLLANVLIVAALWRCLVAPRAAKAGGHLHWKDMRPLL